MRYSTTSMIAGVLPRVTSGLGFISTRQGYRFMTVLLQRQTLVRNIEICGLGGLMIQWSVTLTGPIKNQTPTTVCACLPTAGQTTRVTSNSDTSAREVILYM